MKRVHIHVAVESLSDSIRFYSALFAAEPSVTKSDYAKWMLDDPRVNFAISSRGAVPGLNHLGVQVESAEELTEMRERQDALAGVRAETGAACCYAKSDKYWVTDPQGIAWETFHTLDSIPVFGTDHTEATKTDACCIPLATVAQPNAPCCVPTQEPKAGACC